MGGEKYSGLEDEGEAHLGALVDGLGVDLAGDGDEGLGPPLVLHEGAGLAEVVHAGLHRGEGVQRVLGAESQRVLVAREAVGQLRPHRRGRQRAHQVVVGRRQAVPLVVPAVAPPRRRSEQSLDKGRGRGTRGFDNLQGEGGDEVGVGDGDGRVVLGEGPGGGVEGEVGAGREGARAEDAGEVDHGVGGQPEAGADAGVVVQVLQLHL